MLIFYSICIYVCYTLYKKLSFDNHIILDNISMIDLYNNNKEYDSKEYNYEYNNNNDTLFAFNQIPT